MPPPKPPIALDRITKMSVYAKGIPATGIRLPNGNERAEITSAALTIDSMSVGGIAVL